MLGARGGETAVLRSFSDRRIADVRLLGAESVAWKQEMGLLLVSLPEKLPSLCANALQITLAE